MLEGVGASLRRKHVMNSSSGACGATPWNAPSTAAAWLHGHVIRKVETGGAGRVCTPKLVTTPKLPPPPPRQAQKRSEFWLGVAHQVTAVRSDDRDGDDVVGHGPELPGSEADAPAEREPTDPHRRARAVRNRAARRCKGRLDVDEAGTGADRRDPGRRIELDAGEAPEIDDHAGRRRVPGVAVPARADREAHLRLLRPGDRLGHVGRRQRLHDGKRVDVVEAFLILEPRLFVSGARGTITGPLIAAWSFARLGWVAPRGLPTVCHP